MSSLDSFCEPLRQAPQTWAITGVAGFLGSNLLSTLLRHGQEVVGLDDFSAGHRSNLEDVQRLVGHDAWRRFAFVEASVTDPAACASALQGADYVLHEAALASVPGSFEDPRRAVSSNVDGFVSMLEAARAAGVKRVVYASTSAVYGDYEGELTEDVSGNMLSPYAVTKYANELLAHVFAIRGVTEFVGLRYFNVYGPRQDPNGAYAAVVPRWLDAMTNGLPTTIYGDGETSRDFCFVDDVVEANLRAALLPQATAFAARAGSAVVNVASGRATTLNQLHAAMTEAVSERSGGAGSTLVREPFRVGDIRHSVGSTREIRRSLDFVPGIAIEEGLRRTLRARARGQVSLKKGATISNEPDPVPNSVPTSPRTPAASTAGHSARPGSVPGAPPPRSTRYRACHATAA